jgi:AcrR family transcriptional regulator
MVARKTVRQTRGGLSRERIVAAALDLIDQDGLDAFSTRKLGAALGVEAMSIYHHFPSKQHILDALVDDALQSMEFPPDDVPPVQRLERLCYAYRAMAQRHPKLYPLLALHRTNTPTGVAFLERILKLVEPLAPNEESLARQFRAVGYYLTGAALDETSGYAKGPSAAEPVSHAYIAEHCPLLTRVAPYFAPNQWDATFAFGIDALFAGLRVRVEPELPPDKAKALSKSKPTQNARRKKTRR